jgi:23S rRNA (pseudouridine1915-N3)-methyltransferase
MVAFVVGGAYGLTDAVRERADLVFALSPMVFPHQLVRLLFSEQVYRGLSILKGTGYHHG